MNLYIYIRNIQIILNISQKEHIRKTFNYFFYKDCLCVSSDFCYKTHRISYLLCVCCHHMTAMTASYHFLATLTSLR